ncbi:MAG: DNA repair protein RadA [Jatrophihabitantaceae bacterium]
MTKPSTRSPGFRCTDCGATSLRWAGRCSECQAWGTVAEVGATTRRAVAPGPVSRAAQPIAELDVAAAKARPTGVSELDRVLGGGLVPGSVVLLAGEPGVGKSTLLLEVAHQFAKAGERALVVTGEESTSQVRLRAERTGNLAPTLFLAAENDLAALLTHVDQVDPGLLVVDSVQTISSDALDAGAGGVPQIRAVAAAVIAVAKQRGIAAVLVGHVTKDGSIAGPRVLEHLVDVVLHFEGDRHSSLRLVRATKNRFGAADEVGCFEMREDGIAGLADPSGLFLSDRAVAVPGTCVTVTMEGRRPLVTEVQALVNRASSGGSPRRAVSDLESARVAMLLAVLARHGQVQLAEHEVYASTVGGMAAQEPAADLAIAIALASAARNAAMPAALCAIGEVSLSGDVRRVPALGRRLAEAARLGFTTALVPSAHSGEKVNCAGLDTVPVTTLREAMEAAANLRQRGVARRRPVLRTVQGGG